MAKSRKTAVKSSVKRSKRPSALPTAPPTGGSRDQIDRVNFLATHKISEETLEQSCCRWDDLEWIYTLHCRSHDELRATANYIAERLRQLPQVHSLRVRVKDPLHLVAKVIRKRAELPSREILPENYRSQITDLIGIRALHLLKADWRPIHDLVTRTWGLHEDPVAYYRQGDPQQIVDDLAASGCTPTMHPSGYRSVHYLIESQPTKDLMVVELQVRTIFEEGWSEIDHRVRYPNSLDEIVLNQFLELFNRTAGMADEMGTFLYQLRSNLEDRDQLAAMAIEEKELRIAALEAQVAKLDMSEKQRKDLERELTGLRATVSKGFAPMTMGSIGLTSAITSDWFDQAQLFVSRTCTRCGARLDLIMRAGDLCVACSMAPTIASITGR